MNAFKQKIAALTILGISLFWCSDLLGQSYRYRFQLQHVTDPGTAKETTDLLRIIFNPSGETVNFPAYNAQSNCFEFEADFLLVGEDLEYFAEKYSFVITRFDTPLAVEFKEQQR